MQLAAQLKYKVPFCEELKRFIQKSNKRDAARAAASARTATVPSQEPCSSPPPPVRFVFSSSSCVLAASIDNSSDQSTCFDTDMDGFESDDVKDAAMTKTKQPFAVLHTDIAKAQTSSAVFAASLCAPPHCAAGALHSGQLRPVHGGGGRWAAALGCSLAG